MGKRRLVHISNRCSTCSQW